MTLKINQYKLYELKHKREKKGWNKKKTWYVRVAYIQVTEIPERRERSRRHIWRAEGHK